MSLYYSKKTGRYITSSEKGATGVNRIAIRNEVDSVIDKSSARMRSWTKDLKNGALDLPTWQGYMAEEVSNLHYSVSIVAAGGWNALDTKAVNRIGDTVKRQFGYLRKFAEQIYTGEQSSNGILDERASLYAESARGDFEEERRFVEISAGAIEERNVLGGSDHCNECVDNTGAGWVEIGTLVPVGLRVCGARCRCIMLFRTLEEKQGDEQ